MNELEQLTLEEKRKRQKQLTLEKLEQEPDNLEAIKTIIKIYRREGNIEEEQKYLRKRLSLEPNNPKIAIQLMRMAKDSNDLDELKKLRSTLKHMRVESESQLRGAIGMVTKDKDSVSTGILLAKLRKQAKRKKAITAKQEPKQSIIVQSKLKITLEQEILEKDMQREEETPIQKARRIIYESEDISQDIETIKALLEGQNQTEVALVLAELYFHTGMRERAEKSLKAYKKTLDLAINRSDVKLINQAIELTRTTKTLPYKWEEIWRTIEERKKTFPTALGEDDGER